MKKNDTKELSRRKFLRLAATVVGAGALTGGSTVIYQMTHPNVQTSDAIWRLNPAFRVNEVSANEVELYTHLSNGEVLKHRFSGLEADLLHHISNERKLDTTTPSLAKKYNLSVENCHKQVNQFIQEFSEAKLIFRGEKMLLFSRHVKY